MALDSAPVGADDAARGIALPFDPHIDTARLARSVRMMLRGRDQVALTDVLVAHPPDLGVAEIVGYLALDEDDFDVVMAEATRVAGPVTDSAGVAAWCGCRRSLSLATEALAWSRRARKRTVCRRHRFD